MRKLLLTGISNFKKLREGGYIYVDKTEYIYGLILSYNFGIHPLL
jgi:hypothetical protein